MSAATAVRIDDASHPLRDELLKQAAWAGNAEYCITCGKCVSVCPLHGWGSLDPRRVVRLILLGLEDELVADDWIYQCTGCDRCTQRCPMGIRMSNIITLARSRRARDQVPGGSQKTCDERRFKRFGRAGTADRTRRVISWKAPLSAARAVSASGPDAPPRRSRSSPATSRMGREAPRCGAFP